MNSSSQNSGQYSLNCKTCRTWKLRFLQLKLQLESQFLAAKEKTCTLAAKITAKMTAKEKTL